LAKEGWLRKNSDTASLAARFFILHGILEVVEKDVGGKSCLLGGLISAKADHYIWLWDFGIILKLGFLIF